MQGRCSLVLRRRLCTGGAAEAGRLVYTTDWLRTVTLNCDKLNVRLQPHIVNEVQIGLETADGHPLPPASVAIKGPDGPTDDMDVITLTVASADCPPDADTIALYVPQRFHVDVTTDGGSITQYDLLEGNTSLTAINGNVKAKKVRGAPSVSLRAEGGAVVANIIEGEATLVATRGGSVQAKRVSGPVVNVTVEGGGDLDLASSYGGVVRLATDSCKLQSNPPPARTSLRCAFRQPACLHHHQPAAAAPPFALPHTTTPHVSMGFKPCASQ